MTNYVELCACGHENDHIGRPCKKPVQGPENVVGICQCPSGARVDLVTCQVLLEMNEGLKRQATLLVKILAIVETATGLQSTLIPREGGGFNVDVQPRKAVPQILIPR